MKTITVTFTDLSLTLSQEHKLHKCLKEVASASWAVT